MSVFIKKFKSADSELKRREILVCVFCTEQKTLSNTCTDINLKLIICHKIFRAVLKIQKVCQ